MRDGNGTWLKRKGALDYRPTPQPPGGNTGGRAFWSSSSGRATGGASGFGSLGIPGCCFRNSFLRGRAGVRSFQVPKFNFILHRMTNLNK